MDDFFLLYFENISVRYRVMREQLSGFKEFAIRWVQRKVVYDDFWALRDVDFKLQQGDVLGVIGRNGAGKSTMLKVIARVLHPTRGRLVIQGKVAPLLELGAGFSYELTGRENIYLNGALLGHTRREMDELFPEIIAFAEIGDFVDAPIRNYSTGMISRLGFSVATCTRPDLLLVDEVLSVGDSQFREKCLDRMNQFVHQGTTILLVSHDMVTVRSFCKTVLWLEGGVVKMIGAADKVVDAYLSH
jgi:ABC-2 type transport system ATP-binding protein/lipopolysaccharide transport system ATP-binding protein